MTTQQHRILSAKGLVSLYLLAACLAGPVSGAFAGNKPKVPVPGAVSGNYGLQYERLILSGVGLKDVFQFNSLMTTPYGPAYANIFTTETSSGGQPSVPNFLQCNPPDAGSFSYALCYYSGPASPTGITVDNAALPCTLSPDGKIANCTCYELSTNVVPATVPYFVDINAISNLDVYNKTVEVCGSDGSGCLPTAQGVVAPVCDAINANLLVPGADLISVFSPVRKLDYFAGQTTCHAPGALYAGCMTSPCYRTGKTDAAGNPLVQCSCPVFEGPFEIGQGAQAGGVELSCDLPGNNVWSAAHNPDGGTIDPPPLACIPDAPPETGCPLVTASTGGGFRPEDPICQQVCAAYQGGFSTPGGNIQGGFTCDAALCTTLGLGQSLPLPATATSQARLGIMAQACQGLGNIGSQGLEAIALVEALARCSCCASQICACDPNSQTNTEINELNELQKAVGIMPQCEINGTLCGAAQ